MKLINIYTGERHAYATFVMQLFLMMSIKVLFIWYDIACRWCLSFKHWLAKQPRHIKELGEATTALIPPFHVYAHRCAAT
jgi:hypothetical protein